MTASAPPTPVDVRADGLLADELHDAMRALGLDDPAEEFASRLESAPPDAAAGLLSEGSDGIRRRRVLVRAGYALSILLVAAGVAVVGYTAYLLWGTGWFNERAQQELRAEFDALVGDADVGDNVSAVDAAGTPLDADRGSGSPPEGSTAPAGDSNRRVTEVVRPDRETDLTGFTDGGPLDAAVTGDGEADLASPVAAGEPIALLEIPSIGRSDVVVSGVGSGELETGPGHFPGTPLPGQPGNASIAGHRTSYGAPFRDIDELEPGDEILVTTTDGRRWAYEVTGTQIVDAHDRWVIETRDPDVAELTLISCHPTWSASERIVVSAVLHASVVTVPPLAQPFS